MKISDHHVRSPMLNVNRACQGCHRFNEEELKARVDTIQSRFVHARDVAMDAVVELIKDIQANQGKSAEADLTVARDYQRKAQFYLDYVEAENSNGFHASGEALRILADSVDFSRKGQLALRGYRPPPPLRSPGRPAEGVDNAPPPAKKAEKPAANAVRASLK